MGWYLVVYLLGFCSGTLVILKCIEADLKAEHSYLYRLHKKGKT